MSKPFEMDKLSQDSIKDSVGSPSTSGIPPKRRRLLEKEPEVGTEEQEDDAEEIRNRRIQHIVETARALHSPVNSPTMGRKVVGINGMTNVQITEHYSSCLKLSAENKINSKNAFNLHLIDYMSDILRQQENETNFQIAGTTLDASAKIYAYRVDSVHRETFKIAGGLGRNDKESNGHMGDDDEPVDADGDVGGQRPLPKAVKKRRKKITKGDTIETNEKNLNMNVGDGQFAGDALFDKVRSNFDEGGSSGLFLNTLVTANDSNRLLLHCLADAFPARRPSMARGNSVTVTEIDELLSIMDFTNLTSVCPELGDFAFVGWKPDANCGQEKDHDKTRGKKILREDSNSPTTSGKFAVKLPPPQPDFGLDDEVDDHDDFDNDGLAPASDTRDAEQRRRTTLDAIISAVSAQPLEYSYFDPEVVSTLTDAAAHWKVKTKLNSLKREHGTDKGAAAGPATKGRKIAADDATRRRPGRKRKGNTHIAFEEELDVNVAVPLGSGMTQFSKTQMEQWRGMTGLEEEEEAEEDGSFESDNLRRLFTKPDLWLVGNVKQDATAGDDVNAVIVVDAADVAPARDNEGNMDIDFGASGGEDNDDEDVSMLGSCIRDELVLGERTEAVDGHVASGAFADGLLQQPYKVDKIAVPYARQAKKIDVKRLKRNMWSLLTKPSEIVDSSDPQTSSMASPPKKIAKPMKFSELCDELPDHVPDSLAENLSVPVVFVCLLHMCNEKTLTLESQDDTNDFTISAGSLHDEDE